MLVTQVEKLITVPKTGNRDPHPNEEVFELVLEQYEPETLLPLPPRGSIYNKLFDLLPEGKTIALKIVQTWDNSEFYVLTEKEDFDPKTDWTRSRTRSRRGLLPEFSHLFVNAENKLELRAYTSAGWWDVYNKHNRLKPS